MKFLQNRKELLEIPDDDGKCVRGRQERTDADFRMKRRRRGAFNRTFFVVEMTLGAVIFELCMQLAWGCTLFIYGRHYFRMHII
jgi:hypothetical protein